MERSILFSPPIIFDIDWMIWITLYSLLAIVICNMSRRTKSSTKVILVVVIILFFAIYRAPITPLSFEKFVNTREEVQCNFTLDFVVITNGDHNANFTTEALVVPIRDFSYDYHVFYAKGYLQLGESKDVVKEIKGLNIAGYWFTY